MTGLTSFENAAHVLDELISFHQELAEQYNELVEITDNPLSKMLLEFLVSREKKQAEALERYEDAAPARVLKAWLQISVPQDPEAFLNALKEEMVADLDPLQVYELGSKADTFIADLLTHMQDRCDVAEVNTLFADLLKGERDENIALSKAFNSLREF